MENTIYNINITEDDVNLLFSLLKEGKWQVVNNTIQSIWGQIEDQKKQQNEPKDKLD